MVPLLTIGDRIAKGFDFLGYSFEPKGPSLILVIFVVSSLVSTQVISRIDF